MKHSIAMYFLGTNKSLSTTMLNIQRTFLTKSHNTVNRLRLILLFLMLRSNSNKEEFTFWGKWKNFKYREGGKFIYECVLVKQLKNLGRVPTRFFITCKFSSICLRHSQFFQQKYIRLTYHAKWIHRFYSLNSVNLIEAKIHSCKYLQCFSFHWAGSHDKYM